MTRRCFPSLPSPRFGSTRLQRDRRLWRWVFHRIFTLEFYFDLTFYGFLMGALALANFVIVLWGYYPGELGTYCNEVDSDTCSPVFQARAACFATLVIIL
jgi:Na+-exporting ATPase